MDTKKIRINLSAYTRVEYSEVIEVPVDTTDEELDEKVRQMYSDTDGGEFCSDNDYWEKGHCDWEDAEADEEVG